MKSNHIIRVESPDGDVWQSEPIETTYTPEMHLLAQSSSGYARVARYTVLDADTGAVLLDRVKRPGIFGSAEFVEVTA